MTMPWGSAEEPMETLVGTQSVPIHVASSALKPGKNLPAEIGRIRTIIVANVVGPYSVTPGAQRVLVRSQQRTEARISVLASQAAQATTDGAIFCSPAEAQTGQPASVGLLGGFLPIGKDLVWKSQAELWVVYPASNANTVYVTVSDFTYISRPDSAREEGYEE
jgi:hypothetical protein